MEANAKIWIRERKTGCLLYTSPSSKIRESSLKQLAKLALCNAGASPQCSCADCSSIDAGNHPSTSEITPQTFEERMSVLYSFPIPVIQIAEVHRLRLGLQTRLLIWLESFSRDRLVFLSADTEFSVLPTIRSRSIVFTEIPKQQLSDEERFKAQIFLQSLTAGKTKLEEAQTPEDQFNTARILRIFLVQELQGRMQLPPKRTIPVSDPDVVLALKVLERFFKDPQTHNLRLLMNGFMAHVVQTQVK